MNATSAKNSPIPPIAGGSSTGLGRSGTFSGTLDRSDIIAEGDGYVNLGDDITQAAAISNTLGASVSPPPRNSGMISSSRGNTPLGYGAPTGADNVTRTNSAIHNQPSREAYTSEDRSHANTGGGGFSAQYHSQAELRDTAMAAINQSIDSALRAEVKRMREEVTKLRKESQRASQLADEVAFLRNVTLLQHEEKVPIRLRELERENLGLRRQVATLEEKLKTYEHDEYRQRLAMQRNTLAAVGLDITGTGGSTAITGKDADADKSGKGMRRRNTSLSPTSFRRGTSVGGATPGASGSPKVDIIVRGDTTLESCASCRLKIAAMERVNRADKKELQESLSLTQTRLDAANKELLAIQNWVKSVVANAHQYPHTSGQQPSLEHVATFTSPVGNRERALDPRSSLGERYFQQYADPAIRSQSGLAWSSTIAPAPTYLDARRR